MTKQPPATSLPQRPTSQGVFGPAAALPLGIKLCSQAPPALTSPSPSSGLLQHINRRASDDVTRLITPVCHGLPGPYAPVLARRGPSRNSAVHASRQELSAPAVPGAATGKSFGRAIEPTSSQSPAVSEHVYTRAPTDGVSGAEHVAILETCQGDVRLHIWDDASQPPRQAPALSRLPGRQLRPA